MIVLDTHVIVWNVLAPEKLSKKAKNLIAKQSDNGGLLFCGISLWEIAMLMKKKRLYVDASFQEFIALIKVAHKYVFQGLTPEIAELATSLPDGISKDPADRIIAATAIINNAILITADKNLRSAREIPTEW